MIPLLIPAAFLLLCCALDRLLRPLYPDEEDS